MGTALVSVDFEVFGKVQGVFFRKYTVLQAQELCLFGWVKNDPSGSVIGTIQGSKEAIEKMKHWLQHVGSPKSTIERCEFRNERNIEGPEFEGFGVVRQKRK
eukprot:comp23658_c1_seq3/m.40433 comp23658_c1_seq3/g.40433  ORF comp23658_c1_seq3/g.40433 comp23658_c1_seq3/m.40433 type:complete len:102 (-) comp23658_c1_seq3:33-338(-)